MNTLSSSLAMFGVGAQIFDMLIMPCNIMPYIDDYSLCIIHKVNITFSSYCSLQMCLPSAMLIVNSHHALY